MEFVILKLQPCLFEFVNSLASIVSSNSASTLSVTLVLSRTFRPRTFDPLSIKLFGVLGRRNPPTVIIWLNDNSSYTLPIGHHKKVIKQGYYLVSESYPNTEHDSTEEEHCQILSSGIDTYSNKKAKPTAVLPSHRRRDRQSTLDYHTCSSCFHVHAACHGCHSACKSSL
ncbi:hypothetical protein GQ457_16G004780 [Hibiscus cannabinus]